MNIATCVSLVCLVAAATAASVASSDCSFPGALVCNNKSQLGICDLNKQAVWVDVAKGTECVCAGGSCSIALAADSLTQLPTVQSTTDAAAPFASTQAAAPLAQKFNTAGPGSQTGSGDVLDTSYRQTFSGNGSPSQGWPQEDAWIDFNSMWNENLKNVISNSCTSFQAAPNNSDQESADLKSAIQSLAQQAGLDDRYVLAIVMQESNGCVRAPTTIYSVRNPGLMQSHNGAHTCANLSPCPSSEITGMIADGVMGTVDGDGLRQLVDKASSSASGVQTLYMAARMYNSGSIASSGLLQEGVATHCYVSDIANRLLGWSTGSSSCHY